MSSSSSWRWRRRIGHTPVRVRVVETDTAIVGAGITGLSTAWHLSKIRGKDAPTAVVERETVGAPSQASAVNSGIIVVHERKTGLTGRLCRGSRRLYAGLHAAGHRIEYTPCGMLWVAQSARDWAATLALGYPWWTDDDGDGGGDGGGGAGNATGARLLTADDARALEPALAPTGIAGAVSFPQAASVHPRKALLAVRAEALKAPGTALHERTEVRAVTREHTRGGGRWVLECVRLRDRLGTTPADDGDGGGPPARFELHARTLVLAAGGWMPYFGEQVGRKLGVVPVVGQMWSTVPVPAAQAGAGAVPALGRILCGMESDWAWSRQSTQDAQTGTPPKVTHPRMNGPSVARHLYGKQTPGDGRFIFGGDRRVHYGELRPGNAHPLPRPCPGGSVAANRAHVVELLPGLAGVPVERAWGGIMPFTEDGEPVIGRLDVGPGPAGPEAGGGCRCYVVGGLGSSGMMRGPEAGRLLAQLIVAEERQDKEGVARLKGILGCADPNRWG